MNFSSSTTQTVRVSDSVSDAFRVCGKSTEFFSLNVITDTLPQAHTSFQKLLAVFRIDTFLQDTLIVLPKNEIQKTEPRFQQFDPTPECLKPAFCLQSSAQPHPKNKLFWL